MNTVSLRIVRGEPTPEELAAITALVTAVGGEAGARASGEVADDEPLRGRWSDPAAQHRQAWRPGPGGWRAASR